MSIYLYIYVTITTMRKEIITTFILLFAIFIKAYGQFPPPPPPPFPENYFNFYLSFNAPSLVGPDHTFEGSLIRLPNNDILHLFRLDPGYLGNHVGNNGGIGKRVSKDNGVTWSAPQVIYNDQFDNRFSTAYRLDNGHIVAFFRRYACYDTWNGVNIDSDMIISTDNGETWSDRIYIQNIGPSGCFMNVFKMEGKPGYFASTYANAYIDLRYSEDGYNWDSVYYKWDYRDSAHLQINEPYFASFGNGKVVGLFRAENRPIHQVVSYDYGKTWSDLTPTNIAHGFFCPAPTIMYSEGFDKALIVVTDRRGASYDINNVNSGVWVYFADIDQVMTKPMGYENYRFIQRGAPNIFRMLGYTSTIETSDSTFLVLYSDAYKKYNDLEDAEYYQFTIYSEKKSQTIYIEQFNDFAFDESLFNIAANTSSGLPLRFESSDTTIVKFCNNALQLVGIGTCDIFAYQDGNKDFYFAKPQKRTINVHKGNQDIKLPIFNSIRYGNNAIQLPITSTKNLPIHYESSNPNIIEIVDGEFRIKSAGVCELYASQEGNHLYEPVYKTYTISVDRAFQEILLDNIPLLTYGVSYTNVPLTSSVGLSLDYQISDTNILVFKDQTLQVVGVGQCDLTVIQQGDANFHPIMKHETIIVDKANQTISFAPLLMKLGDSVLVPSVYSSSGLHITLTSSDTSIAYIKDGLIYPVKRGNCYITASQPGNKFYNSAQDIVQELAVETTIVPITKTQYTAYPNPSKGLVYLSNAQGKRVELQTISGEILFVNDSLTEEYIDVSMLPDGIYIIKVIDNDVFETISIVLEH